MVGQAVEVRVCGEEWLNKGLECVLEGGMVRVCMCGGMVEQVVGIGGGDVMQTSTMNT